MNNPTYIRLPTPNLTPLPKGFGQDVRYSRELVEYFINRYTKLGDHVLDPFVGFGTTLLVAKEMGRIGYGVEIHANRFKYMKEDLKLDNVILGDVARINLQSLPSFDLLMTSPPYMGLEDQADATTGYKYAGNYNGYLERLVSIFNRLHSILNPTATIVIEVSNLKQEHSITTLAWDIAKAILEIYEFKGEIIINWEGPQTQQGIYGYGYDHSYCLIFKLPE